jgi:phage regulator Rha-like protein
MNMLASRTVTMSSVEIAEFCAKAHKHVLTDIRKTLVALDLQPADFSARYKDAKGEERECINLPRRETLIVVSGYKIDVRAKIIDRLDELERGERRPMSPAEMFLQNAELMLNIERQAAETQRELKETVARVEAIEKTAPLKAKPQNTETISEIRQRMNRKYGLPERIVNEVMSKLSYSIRPFAMVKNSHENAQGSSFAVYLILDVTKLFTRFADECQQATETTCTHPAIDGRFKMRKNGPA